MKNIALLAIAGIAAGAAAQGVTLTFTADTTAATTGDTIGWTVSASFTGFSDPEAYYGGYVGSFAASNNALGQAAQLQSLMSGEGTAPAANGASVENLNFFNSALLGSDDNSNPIDIFTFTVLALTESGDLSYSAAGVNTVFPDGNIFTLGEEFTANVVSDTVTITAIPAPGAFALLGLGGLAAARRRR